MSPVLYEVDRMTFKNQIFFLLGHLWSQMLGKHCRRVGTKGATELKSFVLSTTSFFCWQMGVVSRGIYLLFWISSPDTGRPPKTLENLHPLPQSSSPTLPPSNRQFTWPRTRVQPTQPLIGERCHPLRHLKLICMWLTRGPTQLKPRTRKSPEISRSCIFHTDQ